MSVSCSSGAAVSWSALRGLASTIDDMAGTMEVEDWSPILSENYPPFSLSGGVSASFQYRFDLDCSANTPAIVGSYISGYGISGALADLAGAGDLFFVQHQDNCWCKTIFKVISAGGGWGLQAVGGGDPSIGCCQTFEVPTEMLDYSQVFIPAGYATDYALGKSASGSGDFTLTGPKCKHMTNGVAYYFSREGGGMGTMIGAARSMSGTFVWPIRAPYMQFLKDKVNELLAGTCGVKTNTVYPSYNGSTEVDVSGFLRRGEIPIMDDLQQTYQTLGLGTFQPGCMTEVGNWPWYSPTCSGESCDGGPRIYCNTLQEFESMILMIPEWVAKFEDPCPSPVEIYYEWSGYRDLDTGTEFNGIKVGYDCGTGDSYISWSNDNTSYEGPEWAYVDVDLAKADGLWTSSTTIACNAWWYRSDRLNDETGEYEDDPDPTGPANLRVVYRGVEQNKALSPVPKRGHETAGHGYWCSTDFAGIVTIYDDGTFTLT